MQQSREGRSTTFPEEIGRLSLSAICDLLSAILRMRRTRGDLNRAEAGSSCPVAGPLDPWDRVRQSLFVGTRPRAGNRLQLHTPRPKYQSKRRYSNWLERTISARKSPLVVHCAGVHWVRWPIARQDHSM